jgi:hypothetical protein
MDLDATPTVRSEFCSREVDEETVILAPSGDQVLSLNAVGSFIWQRIDGAHTVRDIVDVLCDAYEVERAEAEADVARFLDQLADHGLIAAGADGDDSGES